MSAPSIAPGRVLMSDPTRVTLVETLVANNDPCEGYYLSCNYSTLDGVAQHFALPIERITVVIDSVIIYTTDPYGITPVRHRFPGGYTALENPDGKGGVWFKQAHKDYGEDGMWWCISPEAHTMGLVKR